MSDYIVKVFVVSVVAGLGFVFIRWMDDRSWDRIHRKARTCMELERRCKELEKEIERLKKND